MRRSAVENLDVDPTGGRAPFSHLTRRNRADLSGSGNMGTATGLKVRIHASSLRRSAPTHLGAVPAGH